MPSGYDDNDRLLTATYSEDEVEVIETTYAYGPTDLLSKTVVDAVSEDTLEVTTYTYNAMG